MISETHRTPRLPRSALEYEKSKDSNIPSPLHAPPDLNEKSSYREIEIAVYRFCILASGNGSSVGSNFYPVSQASAAWTR